MEINSVPSLLHSTQPASALYTPSSIFGQACGRPQGNSGFLVKGFMADQVVATCYLVSMCYLVSTCYLVGRYELKEYFHFIQYRSTRIQDLKEEELLSFSAYKQTTTSI
jgi:hypothetical protein